MNSPVVVELEHAHATDAAVMRAIGFDNLAAVTEAVGSRVCAIDNWQVMGDHLQDLLLLLLAGRLGQLLQVGQGNAKLKGVEGNGNTGSFQGSYLRTSKAYVMSHKGRAESGELPFWAPLRSE